MAQTEEEYLGYAEEAKNLAVDVPDISFKDAATFVASATPIIGDAMAAKEVYDELQKDDPNYYLAGALGGAAIIGLVPGLGDAAANAIRAGAKKAAETAKRIEVDPNALGVMGGNVRLKGEVGTGIPKVDMVSNSSAGLNNKTVTQSAVDLMNDPAFGEGFTEKLQKVAAENSIAAGDKTFSPMQVYTELKDRVNSDDFTVVASKPRVNEDVVEAERLLDDPEALEQWRKENRLPESQRQRNPEGAKEAAGALLEGDITSKEARKRIKEFIPNPEEFTAEQVREMMPTVTEITGALGKKAKKYPVLGVKGADLKQGQVVSSRLDISAYDDYDTWVVSIHDGNQKSGSVVGYGQAIRLNNINFGSDPKTALDIARGKRLVQATGEDAPKPQGKATIARIFGEYQSADPYDLQRQAADIIESGSDEWVQVGMNPYRGSAFYDKKTGMPVFEADEVIQVGPLVLAKNVKKPTISQMKEMAVRTRDGKIRMFNEGGAVMDNEPIQTEMDLIMSETKDPVSGNTAPLGAKPEEVRDDVPINASPNEFMINAATRRYFGTEFFEELQKSAEEGWKRINEGEESYFRDDELEVMDDEKGDTDKPINMQEGGAVPGAGITVPKPVGGGYGRYGGTGSPFMGFESRTFTSPETGQRIIIYYFNGRPMSRIPAGFREVSQDVVEEQQTVAAERGDDKEDISLESIGISDKTFRNKAVKDWTDVDFKDYNDDLANSIKKGQDPLSLTKAENAILSLVGGAIGLGGAVALPAFAKKAKEKQAEAAHIRALDLMKTSSDKNIIAAADATRYITGSALQKEDYAVSVANPFSGLYKDDDDRNIFDRFFGTQGGLDAYGEPTEEAVKQRYLDQYGTETSNYMEDPFAPPSRAVGQTLAGIKPTQPSTTAPSYATTDMGEAGRTSAPRDEKSSRLDVSNPNTSANVAEHLSDREKESLRAFPETAAHYVATANRRANEAAAGDSSNTDNAKEKSDSGGFSFSDLFS